MDKKLLIDELVEQGYRKNKIKDIAVKYGYTKSELKKFYTLEFFSEIAKDIDLRELSLETFSKIEEKVLEEKKKKLGFIKTELKHIIEKSLYIAMTNGYSVNINNVNSGIMTANAGDSAEFIFVARAILAGFNCSSVDVRSSGYDAIIDYNKRLLRVQIKGISTGNLISFVTRARGGQGIDHKHETNKGKRITSDDCDVYVAVDKQVGICYIIPMSWADTLDGNKCKKVKLSEVEYYKENWDIVKQVVEDKKY